MAETLIESWSDSVTEMGEEVLVVEAVWRFPNRGRDHQRAEVGTVSRFIHADQVSHAAQRSSLAADVQAGTDPAAGCRPTDLVFHCGNSSVTQRRISASFPARFFAAFRMTVHCVQDDPSRFGQSYPFATPNVALPVWLAYN